MAITTASQSQIGQDTAKNSQVVTTVVKNFNSGTLGSGPSITSVVVTDSSYNNLDDTAVTTSNGYIKIIGTGFTSTANVYIGSNAVPAANVTFVSSTEIRARVPVLSVGNYSLSLFNSNSSGTISSSTFIVSTGPVWVTGATLTEQSNGIPFGINLSATSDSTITYANTTSLPAGTTLAANGYFSGTITIGSQTTYSFDVKATDTELQDSSRTFSLTVTFEFFKAWTWGRNDFGSLGTNDTIDKSSPTQIGSDTNWSKLSGNLLQSTGIKTDGTLWTWGGGNFGQSGQNDLGISRSSPTQVGALTTWLKLSKGAYWNSAAIKNDGTLWAWGSNNRGQLGLNNITNKSSPTQVGTDTNWKEVHFGSDFTLAIKTDGTLWSWGQNFYGELGHNFLGVGGDFRSSPIQIGSNTNWSQISASSYTSFAIKTDGTLWSWGSNEGGGLGLNNVNVHRSSPTQVGTDTNWSVIRTNSEGPSAWAFAVKSDGYAWVWGINNRGQLGLNDRAAKSSPVQLYSVDTWSTNPDKIGGGIYSMLAIKSNGTLWVWGDNYYGNLGSNDATTRSSPIQIGSNTNWYSLSTGLNYTSKAITRN